MLKIKYILLVFIMCYIAPAGTVWASEKPKKEISIFRSENDQKKIITNICLIERLVAKDTPIKTKIANAVLSFGLPGLTVGLLGLDLYRKKVPYCGILAGILTWTFFMYLRPLCDYHLKNKLKTSLADFSINTSSGLKSVDALTSTFNDKATMASFSSQINNKYLEERALVDILTQRIEKHKKLLKNAYDEFSTVITDIDRQICAKSGISAAKLQEKWQCKIPEQETKISNYEEELHNEINEEFIQIDQEHETQTNDS